MLYKLPFKGKWYVQTDEQLLNAKDKVAAEAFRAQYERYRSNRISFFLAHGGAYDFINDYETPLVALVSGNQQGKTFSLLAWFILRVIKCDPTWPCFTHMGDKELVCPPWDGQVHACVASYRWSHIQGNIWPKFAELMPMDELKEYSPHWEPRTMGKKRRNPNFQSGKPSVRLYESGSLVDFGAYHQGQVAFESFTYDVFAGDEQMPNGHRKAIRARGLTADRFQFGIGCTPHCVPGQPETGAGTWLDLLWRGHNPEGLVEGKDYKFYGIKMEDVPLCIISQEKRDEWYDECIVQPRLSGDPKAIRAGESRWFGTFESTEGLVYDDWNKSLQWIDPFPIPPDWTRYRVLDPGEVSPTGALWLAMSPWGDGILYREFYEAGLGINKNCVQIIEMSRNRRDKVDEKRKPDGVDFIYEEQQTGEKYVWTLMDSRTFASPSDDPAETLGTAYRRHGLMCRHASGMRNEHAIPLVKEWFVPQEGRVHILVRMKIRKEFIDPGTGEPITKAPKLYVFNTLKHFLSELEGYRDVKSKIDHLMTSLKYLLLQKPRYMGKEMAKVDEDEQGKARGEVDSVTGYARVNQAYL